MERTSTHVILTIAEYDSLIGMIFKLEKRVAELEGQINKNSNNSSKPPSSDGYKKVVKNNRKKSGNKQGGQKGHKGSFLKMVSIPDKIVDHKVIGNCECGENLDSMEVRSIGRRQELELPERLIEVTEHRIESKQCKCGKMHYAPCHLKGNIQYGIRFKSLMVYLNQHQYIPFERLQETSEDLFGISIGDGFLQENNQTCYDNLEQTEQQIKQALVESAVINNDETGMRCEGKTQWIHSTSTTMLTHYSMQEKRGNTAMDAIGILPYYKGISIHDRWASYYKYTCAHGLCNAHLLRDLKYLHEELHCDWALQMKKILMQANDFKKEGALNEAAIKVLEKQYTQIVQKGIKNEPEQKSREKPKRGRVAKSKSQLLLDVFDSRRQEILLFVYNKGVPFDNNLAERDLRMVKLKQKISGCFRSQNGANVFCRIRSYISTARKQGYGILDSIQNALLGKPITFLATEQ